MEQSANDRLSGIRNAAWFVRNYERGGRSNIGRARREQAILKLWLACREAFNDPQADPETVLEAIVDGLRPMDRRAF